MDVAERAYGEAECGSCRWWRPILEDARGRIVGIEVKASATVTSSDLNGLRALAETAGKAWVQGLVLHLGTATVAFEPGLTACPVEALWAPAPPKS